MTTTDRRFVRPGIQRVTTDGKGRWYEWDGNKYWSVTSMLDVLNRHGLNQWRVNLTARAGVDRHTAVGQMLAEGLEDEAYEMLRDVADEIRDERADMGTAFHDHAEAWALGEDRPQPIGELAELVAVFADFVDVMQPTFLLAEAPVFRDPRWEELTTPRYAGTLDAVLEMSWDKLDDEFLATVYGIDTLDIAKSRPAPMPGVSVVTPADSGDRLVAARSLSSDEWGVPLRSVSLVVDYTTAKYVHAEKGLQVCAYRHADFVGMPDGSTPAMPVTDGGAVLQVRADGWGLYPVDTGAQSFNAFLDVASVWDWRKRHANSIIGKPRKGEN